MNQNMTPVDWAKRPIQKYADFSGRAPRAEYWWFFLAVLVASIVTQIVDSSLGMKIVGAYGPLTLLLMLGLIVPQLAVTVRRLHDTDRSGWWILLPIVPYCLAFAFGGAAAMAGGMSAGLGTAAIFLLIGALCALLLLVFMVLPGTPGDNRYGANPYGPAGATVAAE